MLETFESYPVGTQIPELPALGVRFDVLAGGGYPAIYQHNEILSPYGQRQLSNFPNGINEINRYDDVVLHALPGRVITALGYWNGDGQADTLVATAYDGSDNVLGSVGAFKGTFAGFVTDVPIARVIFDGLTGDGWNHFDGLQTNFNGQIPGDLNGDGFVGLNDLDIILNNWNQNVPPADSSADPSGDGFVGLDDLDIVLNNWNAGTPPSNMAIPEPASLSLALMGPLLLLRRTL